MDAYKSFAIVFLTVVVQMLNYSSVSAATLEVKILNELTFIGLVEVSLDSGNSFNDGGGGLIKVQRTGGDFDDSMDSGIPLAEEFFTLCTEIGESISIGNIVLYDILSPEVAPGQGAMGSAKAAHLMNLFNNVYPVFGGDIDGSAANLTKALALQIAVWEIVNETDSVFDVQFGLVQFQNDRSLFGNSLSGTAISQANLWLQGLDGLAFSNIDVLGDKRLGTGKQDLIFDAPDRDVASPDGGVSNVPVPASIWLFASAFGLISCVQNKRSKKIA